jgi:hypothetical protein
LQRYRATTATPRGTYLPPAARQSGSRQSQPAAPRLTPTNPICGRTRPRRLPCTLAPREQAAHHPTPSPAAQYGP